MLAIWSELAAIFDRTAEATMSEPQPSIRSRKARDLAHSLARRTGETIDRLGELALER